MSRSLKKPIYVEAKLFDRICAMNAKGEKKILKTWTSKSGCSALNEYPQELLLFSC